MTWALAILTIWLWFCLVFCDKRRGQFAIFGIPLLLIATFADIAEKLVDTLRNLIASTGEW